MPYLSTKHLDARAGAVDAQPVLAVEDAEDGLGDLQVLAVVGGDEVVERRRDARHDRRAAADAHLEAACTPSLMRGMNPTSWMPVIARSSSVDVNAVLTLRGISCVVGWRTK